ncbi:hypothetical protein BJY16_005428 [Actinoplanes octamycinicus]|uniref:Uncharacterized protein n=1 Tax=Actinoplanes octamycinicus TaxID=135948 RepID=A0A7W7H102_9ACTN|nr:hypothetical protein [Actinoplanes octamycinicus]MBB4741969.1 hypothetical protein [Actinoplanes octamycinicus]
MPPARSLFRWRDSGAVRYAIQLGPDDPATPITGFRKALTGR